MFVPGWANCAAKERQPSPYRTARLLFFGMKSMLQYGIIIKSDFPVNASTGPQATHGIPYAPSRRIVPQAFATPAIFRFAA
jgi:hypothetical protein